jgi:nuclear protein SET
MKHSIHAIESELRRINERTINNIKDTYIDISSIHGFGLFAKKVIPAGTVLCELDGQKMDWAHYEKLRKTINLGEYQDYIFMEWNALSPKTLLVRAFRTKYSYINHSKTPNVEVKYNPIRIEAIQDIDEHDELVIDYSKEPLSEEYKADKEKSFIK